MQVCVISVVSQNVPVQTVTGIRDRDLVSFVGSLAFIQSCNAPNNTLSYQTGLNNASVDDRGADDGVKGMSTALGDIGRFGGKLTAGGAGTRYSLVDYQADIFFGGNFQGYGRISAFRSGELDITWTLMARPGDVFLLTVFGPGEPFFEYGRGLQNGTTTTARRPFGIFNVGAVEPMSATLNIATGSAGNYLGYGWDCRDSNRGSVAYQNIDQSGNARGSKTDRCGLAIDTPSGVSGAVPAVTTWSDTSYTLTGGAGAINYTTFVLEGESGIARAGVFNAPLVPGTQTYALDLDAYWIVGASAGTPTATPFLTDQASFSMGWTNGVEQGCYWVGETTATNVNPIKGARYISNDSFLRLGSANGASTTFGNVAEFVDFDRATGILTLEWTAADGTLPEWQWFAVGFALAPPPGLGMLLTQLPLIGAGPYDMIFPLMRDVGLEWATPPPQRSRRGR